MKYKNKHFKMHIIGITEIAEKMRERGFIDAYVRGFFYIVSASDTIIPSTRANTVCEAWNNFILFELDDYLDGIDFLIKLIERYGNPIQLELSRRPKGKGY